jgi:hypothetical protein
MFIWDVICVEVLWRLTGTVQCVNHTLDDEGRVITMITAWDQWDINRFWENSAKADSTKIQNVNNKTDQLFCSNCSEFQSKKFKMHLTEKKF